MEGNTGMPLFVIEGRANVVGPRLSPRVRVVAQRRHRAFPRPDKTLDACRYASVNLAFKAHELIPRMTEERCIAIDVVDNFRTRVRWAVEREELYQLDSHALNKAWSEEDDAILREWVVSHYDVLVSDMMLIVPLSHSRLQIPLQVYTFTAEDFMSCITNGIDSLSVIPERARTRWVMSLSESPDLISTSADDAVPAKPSARRIPCALKSCKRKILGAAALQCHYDDFPRHDPAVPSP